jgi:hypothetical protein
MTDTPYRLVAVPTSAGYGSFCFAGSTGGADSGCDARGLGGTDAFVMCMRYACYRRPTDHPPETIPWQRIRLVNTTVPMDFGNAIRRLGVQPCV